MRRIVGILAALLLSAAAADAAAPPLAPLRFKPPGPWQTRSFADRIVDATVRYRIAHDVDHDVGEAALAPSIAVGTLTLRAHGRTYAYDLADVLPIRTHRIELTTSLKDGCGGTQALARLGDYLVLETVFSEKGCRTDATFVDLTDGRVARNTLFDSPHAHRNDALPARFVGTHVTVVRADVVPLDEAAFEGHMVVHHGTWRVVVVHWRDRSGKTGLLAYRRDAPAGDDAQAPVPPAGATIALGTIDDPNARYVESDIPRVRYESPSATAAYAPTGTGSVAVMGDTPRDRAQRFNNWFAAAYDAADRGDLRAADDGLAKMIEYNDDISTRPAQVDALDACRTLARSRNYATMTKAAIAAAFRNGCR